MTYEQAERIAIEQEGCNQPIDLVRGPVEPDELTKEPREAEYE